MAKIGIRKPSIKRSIKARTTGKVNRAIKSAVNPLYGKSGMGLINDPKKAVHNAVYQRTTIGASSIIKEATKTSGQTMIEKETAKVVQPKNNTEANTGIRAQTPRNNTAGIIIVGIIAAIPFFISIACFSNKRWGWGAVLFLIAAVIVYTMIKQETASRKIACKEEPQAYDKLLDLAKDDTN
jgi:hypothetical protein